MMLVEMPVIGVYAIDTIVVEGETITFFRRTYKSAVWCSHDECTYLEKFENDRLPALKAVGDETDQKDDVEQVDSGGSPRD